ncbi:MAG: SpoIIE family protein phosphatase, partial [Caulobacteraceae bacterium]
AQAARRFDGLAVPMGGEEVCGDGWTGFTSGDVTVLVMADGLGHGLHAADASGKAVRAFEARPDTDPERVIATIHQSLAGSRGAAVACLALDYAAGEAVFCGVGNIAGTLVGADGLKRMVSHSGTAGVAARRIQAFRYPLAPGAVAVLHSDGLSTSWSLDRYPGLSNADPLLIAALLYRDHSRGRDDSGVVVAVGP